MQAIRYSPGPALIPLKLRLTINHNDIVLEKGVELKAFKLAFFTKTYP